MNLKNKKGLIFFIRHAQTDWNTLGLMQGREDIPLNDEGLEQAKKASKGIKNACDKTGLVFDCVISSPLTRAAVMGKMIADMISCENFFCDERVTERDFGELSGKSYHKGSPAITSDVDEFPSLEKVSHLIFRVNEFISDCASVDKNILVVTHGAVARIYAHNSKTVQGFKISSPFLENCHLVAYSYDGCEMILQGYNISSDTLDEFLEGIENKK